MTNNEHPCQFGIENFGSAELGDKRRTKRIIHCANQMLRHPGGTWPNKFESPKDLKAFYRSMDCPSVTHQSILDPHRAFTFERIEQKTDLVLILHDGTELDYTSIKSLDRLGQIGNGHQRGYICHNSLAIDASTKEVIGLANQILHHREDVDPSETVKERRERESRESRLWIKAVEEIGVQREGVIDVCDRGADTFEFLEYEVLSGRKFVIRSCHNRQISCGHDTLGDTEERLHDYARTLPGHLPRAISIGARDNMPSREAKVEVAFAPVRVFAPKEKHGEHGDDPLDLWIIHVREIDPPKTIRVPIGSKRKGKRRKYKEIAVEPVEWFLLTNEPVKSAEAAWEVVSWYEKRWVVEEYHKALKSGCSIESFQFTAEERLQPAIALTSVVATALLNLRDAARQPNAKERSATEVVSPVYVRCLSRWRHGKENPAWSVHDFYYALGRLGGHQNRRHDPPPGWLILWRGWEKLQYLLDGMEIAQLE